MPVYTFQYHMHQYHLADQSAVLILVSSHLVMDTPHLEFQYYHSLIQVQGMVHQGQFHTRSIPVIKKTCIFVRFTTNNSKVFTSVG